MKAIHYSGSLRWKLADGRTCHVAAGYAACCFGPLAEKIRAARNNTRAVDDVTCKKCLGVMRKAGVA